MSRINFDEPVEPRAYPKSPVDVAPDYFGFPGLQDADAFAARVAGDSMSPKYTPGDVVLFSPATQAKDGDDCFVRFTDGQTTFRRVYFKARTIELRNRCPKQKERRTVKRADVAGIYRAVYCYHQVNCGEGDRP